jgi:hypothetical protein
MKESTHTSPNLSNLVYVSIFPNPISFCYKEEKHKNLIKTKTKFI